MLLREGGLLHQRGAPVVGDEQADEVWGDVGQLRVDGMQVWPHPGAVCAQGVSDGVEIQNVTGAAQVIQRGVLIMGKHRAELVHAGEHHNRDSVAGSCQGNHVGAALAQHAAVGQHRVCAHQHHVGPGHHGEDGGVGDTGGGHPVGG